MSLSSQHVMVFTSVTEFRTLYHFHWNSVHFTCSFDQNLIIYFTSGLAVSNNTFLVLHLCGLEIYNLKCILALNYYHERWLQRGYASCSIAELIYSVFDFWFGPLVVTLQSIHPLLFVSVISILFSSAVHTMSVYQALSTLPSECPFPTIPVLLPGSGS